jgi:hypothetical protein
MKKIKEKLVINPKITELNIISNWVNQTNNKTKKTKRQNE